MRINYFESSSGYIAVTDTSPKDFKGVLYVGKQGTDPSKIREDMFTPDQVRGLPEIAKANMPAAWMLAFGYEKPPEPEPVEEIVEEPLFDPDTFELMAHIPVRRRRQPVAVIATPQPKYNGFIVGLIIGAVIIAIFMYLGWF